eukprot:CAMPEP_0179227980 /NCGR_PEP_ID=MMETSP0797-20121207/9592_1 /TAXON_ID=47934 /ORGANISM="Dinophysis acuminata, Strain DAEP01" /LENGTH=232 /DNA_ID=CAMNT_0020935023 /DNA_START=63 /DNA_END=761 /DNA_ORIENTATION=-
MGWAGGQGGGNWGKRVEDPSKAVWVGNIPDGTTFTELLELAREVGDAKWAQVFKGSAAVGFGSAEEAETASVALDGTDLRGSVLIADTWEKKAPGAAADKNGRGQVGGRGGWRAGGGGWRPQQSWQERGAWQPSFQKNGGGKGGGKGGGRARVQDPSKAVWVGNVPEGSTYHELLALARQVGDAKWAQLFSKGTGVIGFESAESAEAAAATLNGAVLGSASILADTWEKKQR